MILELYGLPGAGKSTLAGKLVSDHGFQKVSLPNPRSIFYWFLIGFVTKPMWHLWLLGWCFSYNRSVFYLWNFYFQRSAKVTKAHHSKHANVVIDEGSLQNALSYPNAACDESVFASYFTTVLTKQRVVVLSPAETVRQQQLAGRSYPGWRTQKLSDDWQTVMKTNFERSLGVLRSQTKIITLTDSQDTKTLLQELEKDTL